MKKLIYLFLALTIVACSSDDDNTAPDNTAPVVTLIGESSITVTQNATYEDAGATATDNVDGDLTSNISTTSNVDTSTLGTYTVTHSVSDASGNNGSASRQIVVVFPAIGQPYQGGIIAYIFQSGDTGYVAGETHGLIAATADQTATLQFNGIQWSDDCCFIVTGATGTAIGTGLTNTNAIIAAQGEAQTVQTDYAAGLARAYNGGGYTDWFLPSKDELNLLYENKTAIGGFVATSYWSSTEGDINNAWRQDGTCPECDGYQSWDSKDTTDGVRAVRAF